VSPVLVKREPDNPFDELAVVVMSPDGAPIGYLSTERAKEYQTALKCIESRGEVAACWAMLYGGTLLKPNIGAWLSLKWPEQIR